MFHKLSKFIYFRLLQWKMIGAFPTLPKYIVAVVPHTSWVDFFLGLLVRSISGETINFIGKKELFRPLTGWFFRGLGGAPIDRTGNLGSVAALAAVFDAHQKFRIAIAPELYLFLLIMRIKRLLFILTFLHYQKRNSDLKNWKLYLKE